MIKTCIKYKLHTYVCYFEDLKIIDILSLISLEIFFDSTIEQELNYCLNQNHATCLGNKFLRCKHLFLKRKFLRCKNLFLKRKQMRHWIC